MCITPSGCLYKMCSLQFLLGFEKKHELSVEFPNNEDKEKE